MPEGQPEPALYCGECAGTGMLRDGSICPGCDGDGEFHLTCVEDESRQRVVASDGADRKYRVAWIAEEEFAGICLRRATNYRLALLKRQSVEPPRYRSLVSVGVPDRLARAYGRVKRAVR